MRKKAKREFDNRMHGKIILQNVIITENDVGLCENIRDVMVQHLLENDLCTTEQHVF